MPQISHAIGGELMRRRHGLPVFTEDSNQPHLVEPKAMYTNTGMVKTSGSL